MKLNQPNSRGLAPGGRRQPALGRWVLLVLLLGGLTVLRAAGQTSTSPPDFTTNVMEANDRGFKTSTTVNAQLGTGFGMDIQFVPTQMTAATNSLLFSVGEYANNTFFPVLTISVKNGQLVLQRRLNQRNTGSDGKYLTLSSWNLSMFSYTQPVVTLRFLISNNTLKFYFYNGTDFSATTTNNRTCEMLNYAMDQTFAQVYLTTSAVSAVVLPPASTSYFTTATLSLATVPLVASVSTASPILGRSATPASSTAPAGCDCQGSLTLAQGGTNSKPLKVADVPTLQPWYPATPTRQALTTTAASLETAPTLTVYPNPAHRTLNLALTVPAATAATATLFDALGRPVFSQALELGAGPNRPVLTLEGLPPGTYQLVLKLASGSTPRLRQKVVLE